MVRVNSNALHAARNSFMKAESSEKFPTALRSNVRTYVDERLVVTLSVI